MKNVQRWIVVLAVPLTTGACSTWDHMSSRERSAVGGAAVGGVVGAAVSNGGVLGTVGGAAIGGVVGDQLGKDGDRRR